METYINQTSPASGSLRVPLDDIKLFVKEDDRTINDPILVSLGKTAQSQVEKFAGHILDEKDYFIKAERFGDITFPYSPVSTGSISVSYVDEDEVTQTLSSSKYNIYDKNHVELEYETNLPELTDDDKYPVTIDFKAGYTESEEIPEDISNFIKLHVLINFSRDPQNINGDGDINNPLQIPMLRNLIQPYFKQNFK